MRKLKEGGDAGTLVRSQCRGLRVKFEVIGLKFELFVERGI